MEALKQSLENYLQIIINTSAQIDEVYNKITEDQDQNSEDYKKSLDNQKKRLKKCQDLSYITNPLINNEYLFKRLKAYIDVYNYTLSQSDLNSETQIDQRFLTQMALRQIVCEAISQSVDKIASIKFDRILQKSMLGTTFNWVEIVTNQYIDIKDQSVNPFQSLNDKDQVIRSIKQNPRIQDATQESQKQHFYSIDTRNNQPRLNDQPFQPRQFQSYTVHQQSQEALWNGVLQQRSVFETDYQQDLYMTFQKQSIDIGGSKFRPYDGSTADITTALPQSERQYQTVTQTDQKGSISIQNQNEQDIQTFSIQSETKDLPNNIDSDYDETFDYQNEEYSKSINPFSQPNEIKLPSLPPNQFFQTQSSLASSSNYNYPSGVLYSTTQHKKTQPKKILRQYVPMKGVPKLIDLTKDKILEHDYGENHDLYGTQYSNAGNSFVQGAQKKGSQSMERKLPKTQLFTEYINSMAQRDIMDPEDAVADQTFWKKEKELNILGQTAILQLKDFKPFNEINLDRQETQTVFTGRKASKVSNTQKKDHSRNKSNSKTLPIDKFEGNEFTQRLRQMEQTIQTLSANTNRGGSVLSYPFLSRGIEIEHQSQNEIEAIKKHMATIGINFPTNVLQRAIFIPKDLDPEGRKYPKIIDQLIKNPNHKNLIKKSDKRSKSNNGTSRLSGMMNTMRTSKDGKLPSISTKHANQTGYNNKLFYKAKA